MAVINVLSKEVSNKIAAGEVVERPASVVKELVENAVDAGSTAVTVEFSGSGVGYIRVTDNGCGIEKSELPKAFLRHATSKLKEIDDLESLLTMGFRGEALAAISSVSKMDIMTFSRSDEMGSKVSAEAGKILSLEEAGCPFGTTVIVRDLFYNTPARMKFLKKDSSEAAYIVDAVEAAAVINPKIKMNLIRDGRQVFMTPGNGKTSDAIYAVYGREIAKELLAVDYEDNGMKLTGFVSSPLCSRGNRSMQMFSLNGRYVRAKIMQVALEEAYRDRMMTRRYPMCFLNIDMDPSRADINVHPSKMEVKFENEKSVFDLIYYGVKSSEKLDERPEMKMKQGAPVHRTAGFSGASVRPAENAAVMDSKQLELIFSPLEKKDGENVRDADVKLSVPFAEKSEINIRKPQTEKEEKAETRFGFYQEPGESAELSASGDGNAVVIYTSRSAPEKESVKAQEPPEAKPVLEEPARPEEKETLPAKESDGPARLIGEAFKTYAIVEKDGALYLIDKHAAHERIIYDELMKKDRENSAQQLIEPVRVTLGSGVCSAALDAKEEFLAAGFEIEEFGANTLVVRTAPMWAEPCEVGDVVYEMADAAASGGSLKTPREERIYHTVACKAATKANMKSDWIELERLVERLFSSVDDIMYCPHGRPVAIKLTKYEIEKQFKRIV